MRHAASYGIVDRQLLFGRYLHRMSLEGMALYLFLVLAADREGRSYYGDRSIGEILRLPPAALSCARGELVSLGLVAHRAPNWWVKELSAAAAPSCRSKASGVGPDAPVPIRGAVPDALRALIRSLEGTP